MKGSSGLEHFPEGMRSQGVFRPGKVKVGWSKDQRELWELGWGGDRIEGGRGRLWGTRAPLHPLVTFPAPLLRVSPHQKKSPHSEGSLGPQACVFGPVILLGTHKKVVISFKTRKKIKVEEHVLIYTVNIFVFMPTIDANVNIFFLWRKGPNGRSARAEDG